MGKRKHTGWLGVAKERGRSTKPMSEAKIAKRWRKLTATSSGKGTLPIRDEMGTMSYPTPKDPPNMGRVETMR